MTEQPSQGGGVLGWIVGSSLRGRAAVVALAVALLWFGPRALQNAPLDVFPEFAPPRVEIQTEAPGLSTEEVESLITVPIENAVIGTPRVATVRSKTVLGLSSVILFFERGSDLLEARQLVQERVARATALLPDVADAPVVLSPLSSTSRVLKIGVSSPTLSQMELTTLAKWTVRPRLMAVPGVANVAIWGQRDRQFQVRVHPDRLLAHGVTLDQVLEAARQGSAVAAGGFIDTPNQRLAVAQRPPIATPADLAETVVTMRGNAPLTLGDVADVVEGFPPPIGDAIINDGPGLLLIVEKEPWGNTLDVTRGVEAALSALAPGLGDVAVDPTIFRPATFIEMSLRNLNRALLVGCLLVVVLLGFFLYNWRTAVISLLAIPLSLLAAALFLSYRGDTINTMVLAGLIIALGEVVDDAIIDVENITRRLRLNRLAGNPRSLFSVVFDASLEVRSAVVFGSLIVVLVFLPVFFLQGLSGAFFRPLALSYILAIAASLAVALTLTPALCLLLLPNANLEGEARLVTRLRERFRAALPRWIARPQRAVQILVVAFGATLIAVPFLGQSFLPSFKEYDFLMHWVEKPGTSIEAMNRITLAASRELRTVEGVRNFGSHIGRAEVADEVVGPNFTELWISLDPSVDYDPTVEQIQSIVDGYPGLYRDLLTYLRERIKEVLTGVSATVVVRTYGPDLAVLREQGSRVLAALSSVEGVIDLHEQQQVLVPQIEVRLRQDAARRFGVTPAQVQKAVATLINGAKVGEFFQDQAVFDVTVWGVEEVRRSPEGLGALLVDAPGGGAIPLRDLADIAIVPAPNEITRQGGSRYLDVTFNVAGRDLGRVAEDAEEAVRALAFPTGYHPEVIGEFSARREANRRLGALSLLVLVGIFVLLQVDFGSARLAGLVFLTLPFALIGGVAAVIVTGGQVSLGSLVGFVTVLGIAARNGIMMVSHFRHLETDEGVPFGASLVQRGAEERLLPIVMTASATALALLPIALTGNLPGHEIEHPMAVVILGGLITSTLLNLFLLPPLYLRFGERAE